MIISIRLLISILVVFNVAQVNAHHELSEKLLRKNFFQNIIGFDEQKILDLWNNTNKRDYNVLLKKHIISKKRSDGIVEFNIKSGDIFYKAGYFQELSLKQVRHEEKMLSKPGGGTFNVIAGQNTAMTSWFRNYIDVGALQAMPENKDAVFQVASNFSALEPVSCNDLPEDGITKYIHDWTQGPFAAISAAPGLILRMYYQFFDSEKEPAAWRQTKTKQLNLLDGVANYFPVTNGYVDFAANKAALGLAISEQDKQAIKVGFHGDIQVTSGFLLDKNYISRVTDPKQCVNQVFTAAIDFGALNAHLKHNKQAQNRAQILLDAAYEGTIKAAAIKHKKKVFLTLIGGGVFKNDLTWIAQAIEQNKQFIQESGLDVTLVIYSFTTFDDFHKRMLNLVKETGGLFRLYKESRQELL